MSRTNAIERLEGEYHTVARNIERLVAKGKRESRRISVMRRRTLRLFKAELGISSKDMNQPAAPPKAELSVDDEFVARITDYVDAMSSLMEEQVAQQEQHDYAADLDRLIVELLRRH